MEILIILGFVIFAVFSVFGVINLIIQINKLPEDNAVAKKKNPKQFDGDKSDAPFVKTRKRKPKSVKDWEEEIDLGGNE